MIQALLGHSEANQASAVFRHEIDRVRCDLLSGERQIAFVLPVLVINYNDHSTVAYFINCSRHIAKWFK